MGINSQLKCVVWIILLACVLTGCGYRLAGSGRLPKNILTVHISEPTNRTTDSRLITNISNGLKNEFTRRRIELVDDPQSADGTLSSEIVSLTEATITRRGETTALEKRIVLSVDLKLSDKQGEIIWMGKGISANETYPVVEGDDLTTDSNKQAAIDAVAQRLAEDVYNRMTADF